eukprot:Phypoly_transcript_03661.p1 GENE.Phypoly_transcript_03661~~Phypoly_transcript_03661.p1  ORF type:complete len:548 (+),score=101.48 Phypoly_transcript_03661:27-1646(+)
MTIPTITPVVSSGGDLHSVTPYDSVVVVAPSFVGDDVPFFQEDLAFVAKADASFGKELLFIATPKATGGRLVLSPTGSLGEDTDDVRKVADAAKKGILRAKSAGSVRPLLVLQKIPQDKEYVLATQVALLSVYDALYERLQARESLGEKETEPVEEVGLLVSQEQLEESKNIIAVVRGIEEGRRLARDVGGPDPERMSPILCAAFIQQAFVSHSDCVTVSLVEDEAVLHKEYPLLHAVARASLHVARHKPVVVRLEYNPTGDVEETVLIAGKGVTYDTGGVDLKVGGFMSGMSRDKCGAAAAAGFVLAAAVTKPPKLRIIAELGFVRNSVGSNAFVSDEIITSHAGQRILIGNTDAEGRMVLADCLSHLRDKALKEEIKNPRFFSIATLTGHVARAYGSYSAAVENAPARSLELSHTLQKLGEVWGEPLEVSTLRREDVAIIAPKNKTYDILQANTLPSSQTARGHQFPAVFLQKASGLAEHGKASKKPLPYTHLDIAGTAMADGDYLFGKPTGTPIVALSAQYVIPRLAQAAKFARKL